MEKFDPTAHYLDHDDIIELADSNKTINYWLDMYKAGYLSWHSALYAMIRDLEREIRQLNQFHKSTPKHRKRRNCNSKHVVVKMSSKSEPLLTGKPDLSMYENEDDIPF